MTLSNTWMIVIIIVSIITIISIISWWWSGSSSSESVNTELSMPSMSGGYRKWKRAMRKLRK
jgi:hypothetical protein